MAENISFTISSVATMLIAAIAWAGGLAGVYFGARGRIDAGEARMAHLSRRLEDGTAKFARIEATHADHHGRLIRLETLLGSMDGKLDNVLDELRK